AGAFGAVVGAEPAGKKAVAIGNVYRVPSPASSSANRARHEMGPRITILERVADNGRLSSGPRRRVDTCDALARHGEHSERIVISRSPDRREPAATRITAAA